METSKGELVPGGLAIVTGCKKDPSNVGKIVTTERKAASGEVVGGYTYIGDGGWFCTGEGLVVLRGGRPVVTGHSYIDDSHLMPINPEADPLALEEDQCQTA